MSKSKRRLRAKRISAFNIWPELNTGSILNAPPRRLLWTLSEKNRWREALDRAAQLLETVAEQMEGYSRCRTEDWHKQDIATAFHESLKEVIDLQDDLDNLRSNF